ncbi:Rz1-like lysis system protein LysC [Limnobaculum allomyrinae]
MTRVLTLPFLLVLLTSCAADYHPPEIIYLEPPESLMVSCEIPEFNGYTWGDAGVYALALKRELKICSSRIDFIIKWRRDIEKKK